MGLSLLAALFSGCAATAHRFAFEPTPVEQWLEPEGQPLGRVLVTVIEGRRAQGEPKGQPEMHLRVRVENASDAPLTLVTDSPLLVGSDLVPFGSARVEPGEGEVAPRSSGTFDLWFPYPPGTRLDYPELDGLNLSFAIEYGSGRAEVSANFDRLRFESPPSRARFNMGVGFLYTSCDY